MSKVLTLLHPWTRSEETVRGSGHALDVRQLVAIFRAFRDFVIECLDAVVHSCNLPIKAYNLSTLWYTRQT